MTKSLKFLLFFFIFSSINSNNYFFEMPLTNNEELSLNKTTSLLFQEFSHFIISHLKNQKNSNNGFLCNKCEDLVYKLQNIINTYGTKGFYHLITLLCLSIYDYDICDQNIQSYGFVLIESFINQFIKDLSLCKKLHFCKDDKEYINVDDYAKRVLSDKPTNKTKEKINKNSKNLKMLQITDLHIDLNYKVGSKAICDKPMCCRDPPKEGDTELAGKFGYEGECDINKDLFQSFIDYAYELKPDFIIWTGDNSPHDTWEGSQEKVIEATKVLRDMINEKFNYEIPIFPVLGNHEVYPNDLFNVTDGKKNLLLEMADMYKNYLSEEAYETFKEKGYYSMLLPNTNLRIISINCFYCDSWNYYLINNNKSDAKQMLKWLEETLRSSEENNEYVYILNHFPLNADFSLIECARRFIALYDRYEYIIRGIFSGHTHHHDIVPVYSYFNRTKITHLNYVSSSLTTHSHQLPSFSIFNIDSTTFQIKDYDVYIFNMNQSNILLKPIWYKSYTATSLFNVEDMSDVYKIINKDVEGDYIIKEYADSKYGKSVCHKESAIRKAKCVLTTDTFYDFYFCNYPKIFALKQDMFVMILNYFEGPWEVDKE